MTRLNRPRWWHRFVAPQRLGSRRKLAPRLHLEPLEPRDVPASNTLSISDAMLLEGNSGTTNMVFTLTRTGDTTTDWQVGYQTVNGTAVAGSDYTAQSGSAIIPAGSATATVLVPIIGNTLDQKDRQFSVVLSGPVFVAGVPFVFAPRQAFAARPAPVGVVQADLNGDGKPDLITANKYGGDISVFMNTTALGASTATFGARQDIATGSGPQAIVAADLNGDGKPDLAVSNTYSNTVTVMINLTTAGAAAFAFGPRTNFNTSPGPLSLVAGDANGDGKTDLLTAGTTAAGGVYNILLNATAQGATTPAFADGGSPAGATLAVALADVNGDGKADLVGTGFGPGANTINVRLNTTPAGGSTLQFAASQNIATSQDISSTAVADVNGDGKPDFVTTSYSLDVVSVLLNTTTAGAATVAVAARHDFETVPFPVAVRVTDMDGDGRPDLLVSQFNSAAPGVVSVFRNLTAAGAVVPSFGTRRDWAAGSDPRDVIASDLNQDGQPDIVDVDRFDNTLSVRLQNSVEIIKATGIGTIVDDDTYLAVGADAGGGPHVRVFAPATAIERFSFFAYGASFTGGVRVAVGDVTGDGVADIITAPGPGGGPHVKVFDGVTGALAAEFFAYGATFSGGVFVAVGHFDSDPQMEIITGAGAGGGPHVRIFKLVNGSPTQFAGPIGSFFAYGASFTGGVSVAAGNVDGAGFDELITGAGPGGGPHVRAFRTDGSLAANFFAYPAAFSGGVNVAAGDVNGDGTAEILTGPGAGDGQSVKVFRADATLVSSVVPYAGFDGAVRVTFELVSGVGEIVTGPGPGLGPRVRRFQAATLSPRGEFDAFNPSFLGGIFVGGD